MRIRRPLVYVVVAKLFTMEFQNLILLIGALNRLFYHDVQRTLTAL